MKTKEYLVKYALAEKGIILNKNGFVADLCIEFLTYIETGNALASEKAYQNKVNMIRQKYDAINNACQKQISANLWDVFYSEIVVYGKKMLFDVASDAKYEMYKTILIKKISKSESDEKRVNSVINDAFIKMYSLLSNNIIMFVKHMPKPIIGDTETMLNIVGKYNIEAYGENGSRAVNMPYFNKITFKKNQKLAWILTNK